MHFKRSLALVLLIGLWLAPSAYGQTILNFPRIISNANIFSGLAVGNPTPAEASITFTAIQPDGSTLTGSGIQNPVTLTIPAGGQVAKLFSEIFGARDFNGWVQATSATKGLTGFFLNGNAALTDIDGAGAIDASAEFVLPLASEDASAKTEVTIVNVNLDAARATFTLYASDGAAIATRDLSIPARGLIRQTLRGIFTTADLSAASHIRVRSDRPVIGHEVVVDFLLSGSSLRRESVAFSGQSPTSAVSYVLPQFATGGGWISLIGIVNGAGVGQEVTLTAYKEDGTLWNIESNPKRVSMAGNGSLQITAGELFGFPGGTFSSGWVAVQGSIGYLSSYIAYGNSGAPSFAAVAGTEALRASRYEVFSHIAEGGSFYTGITLINPGTQDANVEFYTLRSDGTTIGRSAFIVKPKERVARLFSELLPSTLNQLGGWGFVRSTQPVIGAVLFGSTNGYSLANVPQQIPAGDFIPPAQTTGAISGVVLGGGQPLADVQVSISGPVVATTTTDSQGRYTFPQLPAGDYRVAAARLGAQFVPIVQTVPINRQNVDGVNFEGGGVAAANAPVIEFISPSSSFAGNRAFSIRVLGRNFTPTSVIKLGDQPLLTSFVSAVELQAIMPAAQAARPGTLKITVETPPPGGGTSTSMDFTINPAPSDPLIEGRGAVGSFPTGVAIDSARNTALVTNQSGDTVTVIDLKSLAVRATIPVGRSPAEGIAVHRAKNIALVANPGSNNVSAIDLTTGRVAKEISVGRFPVGVAVNNTTNRAVVTNAEDGTLNVIDLDLLSVVGQVSVGTRPLNVAIQSRTNQAVVTDPSSNAVWIVDLNTNTVLGRIGVGQFPRGVAVNPTTNMAVVANANSNDISVIDLGTRAVVLTTKVDVGPTGVAIHEGTNIALITNSAVPRGSSNYSVQSTVSVFDLGVMQITRSIPVGSAAFGIDVDQDAQRAVIANFGSNDVTAIRVPNPKPRIDDVSPKTFPAGGPSFTITIQGVGFVRSSVVTLNGQSLPTTYVSYNVLRAEVSAALRDQLIQVRNLSTGDGKPGVFNAVTPLTFSVGINNQEGGDSSSAQISLENAVPVLISISPVEATAGVPLTLTLSGNNFNGTSIINIGTLQNSPTTSTPTSITTVIPASAVVAGNLSVFVTNPPPGGGTSAILTLKVGASSSAPTVTGVNPSSIPAGSGAATVTVTGTAFAGATATLDSSSGSVSGNTIVFNLSADQTANPRTLSGLISGAGGGTAAFSVNVLNPVPTASGVTPNSADAGSPAVAISVTGTNFRDTSQITVEGTPISTRFVSDSSLSGTIPESFLIRAGDLRIAVLNPAPGGGSATAGTFSVKSPQPTLTGSNPSKGSVQNNSLTIRLIGTGFIGNSTASANGSALSTVYDSATSLTVTIPAARLSRPGVLEIKVTNPAPGGGTSGAIQFTVENPVPVLTAVSPQQLRADQPDVVITATGRDFVDGARISVGTQSLVTTFVSATTLTGALVPPYPLGKQTVVVTNPGPGGGVSAGIDIEITALAPSISGVSPGSVGPGEDIQVTGTNLGPGSTILLRGQVIPTTATSSTQLTGTIPATATTGSADIVVRNPATSAQPAQDSNSLTIQIVNPLPSITSLEPTSAAGGTSITIRGRGFIPSSQVLLNGSPLNSSFGGATTLTFTLPDSTPVGSASVEVSNAGPGGGASNTATLTVQALTPIVSGVSPSSGTAGTSVTLTVSGSRFASGAAVIFNGSSVGGSVVNSGTMTVTFTLPVIPGSVTVGVRNPGGVDSNTVNFTILAAAPPPPPPPPPPSSVPTITNISQNSAAAGSTGVSITINGTNFVAGGTTVAVSGLGVTVGTANVASATQLTTTFTIDPGAATTPRNVTVTTSGGISGPITFTVTAAATAFTLSSNTGNVAGGSRVVITGSGFTSANVTVKFGTSFGAGAVRLSTTQVAVFTPPHGAGSVDVTVTSGTAQTVANGFTYSSAAVGNAFTPGQNLGVGRSRLTATMLIDGRILVAGGSSGTSAAYASTEISNASTGAFSAGPTMATGRYFHTATPLADGRVLIVGGYPTTNTTELLDVAGTTFTAGPPLTNARYGHTATLLADGRILVVGGLGSTFQPIATAEVFDPGANTWSAPISLATARAYHQATLTLDGLVLVTGGGSQTAEIFNPTTNTFSAVTSPMQANREGHVSVLLPNGKVLLATGSGVNSGVLRTAETFDGSSFTATAGTLPTGAVGTSAVLLGDGTVLIAGGDSCSDGCETANSSTFNPSTGTFTATAPLAGARTDAAAIRLADGKALIVGGFNNGYLNTTEIFGAASVPRITSLIPSQRVVNSGAFTLDVIGTNFVSGARVIFNGATYATTFIDAQHLAANILAGDISSNVCSEPPCSINVVAQNPDPANAQAYISSNTATFNIIAPAIILSPNPLSASSGAPTPLTVSVNQSVTVAGGINITMLSDATNVATVATPAHINQGDTATTINVTGGNVGSATITASLAGYTPGSATVNVTATPQPIVNITPPTLLLSAAGTGSVTVARANSLNQGAALDVDLAASRSGYFSFPSVVTIPGGLSSISVPLTGIQPDPTPPVTLSASAIGHLSGSTTDVTVRILRIQITPAVLVNPSQSTNLQVTLSDPAPVGGVTITFVSRDPAFATIANNITIPAGSTQASTLVNGVAVGTTVITATAPGYPPTTSNVQVQNVNLSIFPSSATFFSGAAFARGVTLAMTVNALEGGQLVNLSSSDASVATVPPNVFIPAGTQGVSFAVTGIGPGTATVTASSPGLNSGTFSANVLAPTFRVDNSENRTTTSTGIRESHYVQISGSAPIGGVPVTITSSDPAKLKVAPCQLSNPQSTSCDDASAPRNSVTITVPPNENYVYFDVVGQDVTVDDVRVNLPNGVARDAAGNTYVAERNAHIIRKIDAFGLVSRFAGTGTNGHTGDNGPANAATLGSPAGVTVFGNALYIAEFSQNVIRKIDLSNNQISTVVNTLISQPYDVAFNSTGDMFIASSGNGRIYKLDVNTGALTVIAGGGTGSALATNVDATTISINPSSVAIDAAGNVYYADQSNDIVNQIDATRIVRRVAGTGTQGTSSGDVSDATTANLNNPRGVAVDRTNRLLYISDAHRIQRVDLNATQPAATPQPLTRIAGGASGGCCNDGLPSRSGFVSTPEKMFVDSNGDLFIADSNNNRVRQISFSNGTIDTVIGDSNAGSTGDGQPARGVHLIITTNNFITQRVPVQISQSQWTLISLSNTQTLGTPFTFTVRTAGNDRMADATTVTLTALSPFTLNSPLNIPINGRSVLASGTTTGIGTGFVRVDANGTRFLSTTSNAVTVLPQPVGPLLFNASSNPRLDLSTGTRQETYVSVPAAVSSPVTVNITSSDPTKVKVSGCNPANTQTSTCTGDVPAASVAVTIPSSSTFAYFDAIALANAFTDVRLNEPYGVHVDSAGNVYIADRSNYRIRKLSAGGVLSTFAGNGSTTTTTIGANQQATATSRILSRSMASDAAGNVYIALEDGYAVVKVDANGVISVVAGQLNQPGIVEGALGTAKLSTLYAVAVGSDGSLYIADEGNARIRKVQGGTHSTLAGGGASTGTDAQRVTFNDVRGVAVDPQTDDVYISEYGNNRVWRVTQPAGTVELVAGTGGTGFNGDQTDATQATVSHPLQLHVAGNYLYIAEEGSDRIRRVNIRAGTPRLIETIAGSTSGGFSGDGDMAIVAKLSNPGSIWTDANGDLVIADRSNQRIRKVTFSTGKITTIVGSGTAGFAGDGTNGRGVTLHAEVAPGGPNYLPADTGVNVLQSSWLIDSYGTSQSTTSNFTYRVRTAGNDRLGADTSFTPTSNGPFTLSPLTILDNARSVTGTAVPTASGAGTITIPAVGTSFLSTTSNVIVVTQPALAPLLFNASSNPRLDLSTGTRQETYVSVPAAVSSPVTVNITSSDPTKVKVSGCNPANTQTSTCTGDVPAASVAVTIPSGSTFAYFDAIALANTFTDVRLNEPYGVHVDAAGNLYIADRSNFRIRKLSAAGVLSTFAGNGSTTATTIGANQQATATSRILSRSIASDGAGNVYIVLEDGYAVVKVDANGVISVVAGQLNQPGIIEGPLGTAKLSTLYAVAVGSDGSLYVADEGNGRIRKVQGGVHSTLAGGGALTGTDAQKVTFNDVRGVAVDPMTDDIYISEYGNNRVWRVTQPAGTIELVAGTGGTGFNGDMADATLATVYHPLQLHVAGNYLYIADEGNDRIRRVNIRNGMPRTIETVAGTTSGGFSGDGDLAIVAKLSNPGSIWTDTNGDLYIADRSNQRIRKVTLSTGKINTIVGSGTAGFAGDGTNGRGVTLHAEVAPGGPTYLPADVGVNVLQSSWLIESYGTSQSTTSNFTYRVRSAGNDRMAADTTFTPTSTGPFTLSPLTVLNNARSVTGTAVPTGSGNGTIVVPAVGTSFLGTTSNVIVVTPPAVPALFFNGNTALSPVVAATGTRTNAYVQLPATATSAVTVNITSSDASRLKVTPCNPNNTQTSTCTGEATVGGGVSVSVTIPSGSSFAYFDMLGLTTAFTDARLNEPYGVHVDAFGNIYIADRSNFRIRKLNTAGVLRTFAGNGSTAATTIGSNQQATATSRILSRGIASDSAGNVYIALEDGYAVAKVATNGVISVVAGQLNSPGLVEGALGTAKLSTLYAVAVGSDGSLYIADQGNARVRKVQGGTHSTLAGGGSTSGTAAQMATFSDVRGVAVDPTTNDVYISDYGNNKVWRVTQPAGAIELVAGTGVAGFNGDQMDATQATLNHPLQLHIAGNYLYIADEGNDRIRRVNIRSGTPRMIETIAGTTAGGFSGDGDLAIVARLSNPGSIWTDPNGDLLISDRSNQRIRKVTLSTGKINTIIGSGQSGFGGDCPSQSDTNCVGFGGRGVTLRAQVAAGGPNYLPAEVGVRVNQSTWEIVNVTTPTTGPTLPFRVRHTAPEVGTSRMNADTTFDISSQNTSVFDFAPPRQLTIPNNLTFVDSTANTLGAGTSQIIANASITGIDQGSTSQITVQPVINTGGAVNHGTTTAASGPAGQTTAIDINGRNLLNSTGISAPSGITANITAFTSTQLNVNVIVASGVTPGAKTLTLLTPTGNVNFTFTVN